MAQRHKWKIVDKRPKLFGLSASLWRKVCDSIANMKRFQLKLATSQREAEAATASTATFCIPLCCVWPADGLCEIKNISTNRWKRSPFVCVLHNNSNTKAHTGANEPPENDMKVPPLSLFQLPLSAGYNQHTHRSSAPETHYYHFPIEFLPKIRFAFCFDNFRAHGICVPFGVFG